MYKRSNSYGCTRKKFLLEEFPKFSEIENIAKVREVFNDLE